MSDCDVSKMECMGDMPDDRKPASVSDSHELASYKPEDYRKAIEWLAYRLDSDSINWIKREMHPRISGNVLMAAIDKAGGL